MSFSGTALDELILDDPISLVDSIQETNSPISNSISAGLASSGLLGSSAPVNIPGMTERSVLSNFSPSTSSPLQHLQGFLTQNRFSHADAMESVSTFDAKYHPFQMIVKTCNNSPCRFLQSMPFMNQVAESYNNHHISQLSSSASKLNSGFNSSLFDFANQAMSPSRNHQLPASPLINAFSMSPSNSGSLSEVRNVKPKAFL